MVPLPAEIVRSAPRQARPVRSAVGQAISNTSSGEWILYGVLVVVGAVSIVLGLRLEVRGWATSHAYSVNLLSAITGFCFGVPVAGVIIKEFARRGSEAAERRSASRAVISQLDYIFDLVRSLLQGTESPTAERLAQVAESAESAATGASAKAISSEVKTWIISIGGIYVQPQLLPEELANKLKHVAVDDRRWATIGFTCHALASDVRRLITVQPSPPDPRFIGMLEALTGALQQVLILQLPAQHRWLSAALKDPPARVPVEFWSSGLELSSALSPLLTAGGTEGAAGGPDVDAIGLLSGPDPKEVEAKRQSMRGEAEKRAKEELRLELSGLASQLHALAALIETGDLIRTDPSLRKVARRRD